MILGVFSSCAGDLLPELEPFVHAIQARRPDAGTWCEAWTTRDVLIHNTGNAEELARVLRAHMADEPAETRGFDRENPYREFTDPEPWSAFIDRCDNSSISPAPPSAIYRRMNRSCGPDER